MEIKAQSKFIKTSPRKLRLVARAVLPLKPSEALVALSFMDKAAAGALSKTIKSALASAKNAGLAGEKIKFDKIEVNKGPTLKRGRPVSRGSWHPILKRTSHITVVLKNLDDKAVSVKNSEANQEKLIQKKKEVVSDGTKS